ncbi:hypothetical protein [Paenibacillus kandeliae]|uniref:hypothetical protein n=1 Tax=Paenibacillus kandeliae TaxID=3231269 RepID=UPI00345A541B
MEDFTQGVEETVVAEPQNDTEDHAQNTTDHTQETPAETGVEDVPAAEVQDDGKDFSKALNARTEQIRQKLEDEYKTKYDGYDTFKRQSELAKRTASLYGFDSVEAFEQALQQEEQNRHIAAEAQRLGVDEDVVRQYVQPLNEKVTNYEQELNQLKAADQLRQVEAKIAAMEQDTVNFPDFAKYKNEIIAIAAENGLMLDHAYKIHTYDSRVQAAKQQAEQETIRKLQQNANGSPGALGADDAQSPDGYLGMNAEQRKAFRERVKAGQYK